MLLIPDVENKSGGRWLECGIFPTCSAQEEPAQRGSIVSMSPTAWMANSKAVTYRGQNAWRGPVGSLRLIWLIETI